MEGLYGKGSDTAFSEEEYILYGRLWNVLSIGYQFTGSS